MRSLSIMFASLLTASTLLIAPVELPVTVTTVESYPNIVAQVKIVDQKGKELGGGSGVVIESKDGEFLLLTAEHVVDDIPVGSDVFVEFNGKLPQKVTKIIPHEKQDAALLVVSSKGKSPKADLKFEVIPGEDILTAGFPMGLEFIISDGLINYRSRLLPDNWVCTAPTAPGNSGGGVFDKDTGELLGICIAVANVQDGFNSQYLTYIHFFLPLADVEDWIENHIEAFNQ